MINLGGGFSNIFDFHPETWGNDSHFDGRAYFVNWVGEPTVQP